MAKALSMDHRRWVVAAIVEVMSRRQAVVRFGASAVKWHNANPHGKQAGPESPLRPDRG